MNVSRAFIGNDGKQNENSAPVGLCCVDFVEILV